VTSRSTYESSVRATAAVLTNSENANVAAYQTTIDASNSVVGYNLQTGNNAALVSAMKSATAALAVARQAERWAQMASIDQAKNTLTATGDVGPG
jgi:hypothetical protein